VTTPPRPTLDETLARIDAVLAEPEPAPPAARLTVARVDQLLAADTATPLPNLGLVDRAIGWFRR
jgi:hypothetical protein